MSSATKWAVSVVILSLLYGAFLYYYHKEQAYVDENIQTLTNINTVTPQLDVSDAALDKDTQTIDKQLQGLASDINNAEQSVNGIRSI